MSMPAFAQALRGSEEGTGVKEEGGGVLDAERGMVLIEDVGEVEDAEDVEDVKDELILLVGKVVETDVVEFDAPCRVRDSGEGAWKVSLPGFM